MFTKVELTISEALSAYFQVHQRLF